MLHLPGTFTGRAYVQKILNRLRPKPESNKLDRGLMRQRIMAALEELKKNKNVDPNRIAVIGYCFGGTVALELGRSGAPVAGIVTFHGGLDSPKPEDGKNIKAKVLILHGADDPLAPPDQAGGFSG